jgi:DNA-directed RNA polymerase specialized sigma24 family protein
MLTMPTEDEETNEPRLRDRIVTVAKHRADLASELARTDARLHDLWRRAQAAGASYRQIADASGVDHTTVYKVLTGQRRATKET